MRGTEFDRSLGQVALDLGDADFLGIGVSGYANRQTVEMVRYWKSLTTVGGQSVSCTDTELQRLFMLKIGVFVASPLVLSVRAQTTKRPVNNCVID
jgi:hypothetical protein